MQTGDVDNRSVSGQMETKTCKECGEAKPLTEFWTYRNVKRTRQYPYPKCKTCTMFLGRLQRHGLTRDQFEALRIEQGDACAICGVDGGESLHIDHCHDSGNVRGLLCQNCNIAIGLAKDDPAILRAAAAYLERTAA